MKKKRLFADLLLLLFLLFLSLTLFFLFRSNEEINYVEIRKGDVSTVVSLNRDQVLTLEGKNGISLTVRIENSEIFVESATCKDKVCVSRGRLKNSGDIAVCLPAEISIRVFGESGVDVYA